MVSLRRAGERQKGGLFSFLGKRIAPLTPPPEKGIRLAVSDLNDLHASGMQLPARGGAAFSVAIRFASAPTIRCCAAVGGSAALRMRHTPCGCRSAHLVGVQPNHRLPPASTMRRAPAMPLFRTQSAAVLTSHAPHDSKARLQSVTTRRRFMAKPCTPHPIPQAEQLFKIETANVRGRGGRPLVSFSWGCKGDILFREREYPP